MSCKFRNEVEIQQKKFKDEIDYLYIRMIPLIFSTVPPLAARETCKGLRRDGFERLVNTRLGGDEGVIYPSRHGIPRKIILWTVKIEGTGNRASERHERATHGLREPGRRPH